MSNTTFPVWNTAQNLINAVVVAAGANITGIIDLKALQTDIVSVQVAITYGAGADANSDIDILNSADEGVTLDTQKAEPESTTMNFNAGNIEVKSLTVAERARVVVRVKNNNSAEDITVTVNYATRHWRENKFNAGLGV